MEKNGLEMNRLKHGYLILLHRNLINYFNQVNKQRVSKRKRGIVIVEWGHACITFPVVSKARPFNIYPLTLGKIVFPGKSTPFVFLGCWRFIGTT